MRFKRIKGEDKPQNVVRLPRLGHVRLGMKKKNASGKEYPVETKFFVLPDELKRIYGDEPTSLPCMIPVEDEEMFMTQSYRCYGTNQKLKCHGDGERAERRNAEGKMEEIPCPSPSNCDFAKANGCRARIDVMVVLPQANMGGVWQISSGSVNSDIDIRSGIAMARHLFGRVAWTPMILTREERKIADPETGKMNTHFPCRLYPVATVEEVNQIRMDTTRILDRQSMMALPEPVIEGEFTREPEENDSKQADAPPEGIEMMLEMIAAAQSQHEINQLFKSNLAGINALPNKDKARLIEAKHKKEAELSKAA